MTLRHVSIVLFDGFEPLDVFGPAELLGTDPELFELEYLGPEVGLVRSAHSAAVEATRAYRDARDPDILLVPGGLGTRSLVDDQPFIDWLSTFGRSATLVTSVCTGAALLAAAGLLDGYRATTNKAAFRWVEDQGPEATWVPVARWVHDRDRWTSSGVAAGIDMAAALIADLHGAEAADRITTRVEIEVQKDPSQDPFAARHGLV